MVRDALENIKAKGKAPVDCTQIPLDDTGTYKSHWGAYLKTRYLAEFMAALLRNPIKNMTPSYLDEARRVGVTVFLWT